MDRQIAVIAIIIISLIFSVWCVIVLFGIIIRIKTIVDTKEHITLVCNHRGRSSDRLHVI